MAIRKACIGNSRVLRKSKTVRRVRRPRAGWADAFNRMAAAGDDNLVHGDAPIATLFDEVEWRW